MFFGVIRYGRYEVPTHTEHVRSFAFKTTFSWRIFRFSRLGVVSLLCEWSWHLVTVWGSKERYFLYWFHI
jgi:hypothetical protein